MVSSIENLIWTFKATLNWYLFNLNFFFLIVLFFFLILFHWVRLVCFFFVFLFSYSLCRVIIYIFAALTLFGPAVSAPALSRCNWAQANLGLVLVCGTTRMAYSWNLAYSVETKVKLTLRGCWRELGFPKDRGLALLWFWTFCGWRNAIYVRLGPVLSGLVCRFFCFLFLLCGFWFWWLLGVVALFFTTPWFCVIWCLFLVRLYSGVAHLLRPLWVTKQDMSTWF